MKAAEVRAALKRIFSQPQCAIVFEVAQSTGFNAHRHLDAVAMDLWPSRGLALHGIEIKVSVYDWRKELNNPEKAEQIARFCDFFWVAAPVGVVPIAEVPEAWGLIEVADDGTCARPKQARKTESQPVTREFLAAMMRASGRIDSDMVDAEIVRREKTLQERFDERLKNELEHRSSRANEDGERWRNMCEALGIGPDRLWYHDDAELIACIKAVRASGAAKSYEGLHSLLKSLTVAADNVRGALGDLEIADPKPAAVIAGRRKRA